MSSMGLSAPLEDSKTNNYSQTPNCHQNLEMVTLDTVNQLMMIGATTQLAPSQ